MKFLDRLSAAYYMGEPLVSNEFFDELAKRYDYQGLGTNAETEIKLKHKVYSLQKVYPGEAIPFSGGVKTPKLDGSAVALYYEQGHLVWASTRGNGEQGQDITDKMATLVPTKLLKPYTMQITGEVVTTLGKPNIRNYASGALNLKSVDEFKKRELYFVAYDTLPAATARYTDNLQVLMSLGFNTVGSPGMEAFPQDGVVVRVNDCVEYNKMGYTSKHPRGAYALKENKQGVRTTLRDIVWQVGRSGVVSPVCIFDPVNIDGATVTRATGHNWKYIEELDLVPDCGIEVIRAGEIIPRVLRRVYD